ncbi:hypothetical protein PLICRDRAFT_609462 [Plicaturopsis crispa FD-325 SS-3]|nr:hypothetical protein PLICRDRAFT_609462 [Plicaturopsis crispa FD-325 SS-3]
MAFKNLPAYDDLPPFKNFPGCAWEVWGKDDQLGTINLLTPELVKQAATEEIQTGKTISLNWPINFPSKPMFSRKEPQHTIIAKRGLEAAGRDDELHINTQSGTQWDGLKHFGILEHGIFYNNTPAASLQAGQNLISDPLKVDLEQIKLGIHNWAQHGICGRGVLIDMVNFYTADGSALPYDPWTTHPIPVADIKACAEKEGVQFRPGDILILRVGFIQRYYASSDEKKSARQEEFAGVEQSEDMKRFMWDNHFAAVASDQPAFEAWPPAPGTHLHQTFLGLWGMPIGEFFDVEALSKHCAATGRYTFFFSSWPLNVLGGVASPPNAAVRHAALASVPTTRP